jgi:hypothetical protein
MTGRCDPVEGEFVSQCRVNEEADKTLPSKEDICELAFTSG